MQLGACSLRGSSTQHGASLVSIPLTSRGDFALALALGLVLLLVAFAVTVVLTTLQQRAAPLRA